jgi:hypothetical protein
VPAAVPFDTRKPILSVTSRPVKRYSPLLTVIRWIESGRMRGAARAPDEFERDAGSRVRHQRPER